MWILYNTGPSIFSTHSISVKTLRTNAAFRSDQTKLNPPPHHQAAVQPGRWTPERHLLARTTNPHTVSQCLQPLALGDWGGSVVQLLYIESSGLRLSQEAPPSVFWTDLSVVLGTRNSEKIWQHWWHCVHMDGDVSKGIIRCKCILFKVLKKKQLDCGIKGHVFIYSVSIGLFSHIWDNKRKYCTCVVLLIALRTIAIEFSSWIIWAAPLKLSGGVVFTAISRSAAKPRCRKKPICSQSSIFYTQLNSLVFSKMLGLN